MFSGWIEISIIMLHLQNPLGDLSLSWFCYILLMSSLPWKNATKTIRYYPHLSTSSSEVLLASVASVEKRGGQVLEGSWSVWSTGWFLVSWFLKSTKWFWKVQSGFAKETEEIGRSSLLCLATSYDLMVSILSLSWQTSCFPLCSLMKPLEEMSKQRKCCIYQAFPAFVAQWFWKFPFCCGGFGAQDSLQ